MTHADDVVRVFSEASAIGAPDEVDRLKAEVEEARECLRLASQYWNADKDSKVIKQIREAYDALGRAP